LPCAVGPVEILIISDDILLNAEESVLLVCVAFGEPSVDIAWSFNRATFVNSSLVTIYEEQYFKGGRVLKQSFLQLCGVSGTDAGAYRCTANNGLATANATTQLNILGELVFFECQFAL
jgi:hypothetical protein